jgi:hypothetical protein
VFALGNNAGMNTFKPEEEAKILAVSIEITNKIDIVSIFRLIFTSRR